MDENFATLGAWLLRDMEAVQKLWARFFGEHLEKTLRLGDYTQLLFEAQAIFNANDRKGHLTLFIRDPVSDRLYLEGSTHPDLQPGKAKAPVHHLSHPNANWDSDRHKAFYPLHDRLVDSTDCCSEAARKNRGLTGWVAVTGFPIRLNSERDKGKLEDFCLLSPERKAACQKYGSPLWGQHISEYRIEGELHETKRYLAVPVKSVLRSTTIGVLRYSCPLTSRELTHSDVPLLSEIASIVAAIAHMQSAKIRLTRSIQLQVEKPILRETADFHGFLRFAAINLRSYISSLYLPVTHNGRQILRLFEAYGIGDRVGTIRTQLKDYSEPIRGTKKTGVTWDLFTKQNDAPVVIESVVTDGAWLGQNTGIFYKKHIPDDEIWRKHSKKRLGSYTIKLIGTKLIHDGKTVGVLKVEFPTMFDSDDHYSREDSVFFSQCASVVAEEAHKVLSYIDGSWFRENKNTNNVVEFTKISSILYTSGFFQGIDLTELNKLETDFVNRNLDAFHQMGHNVKDVATKGVKSFVIELIAAFAARSVFPH